jgi:hypothetical protein
VSVEVLVAVTVGVTLREEVGDTVRLLEGDTRAMESTARRTRRLSESAMITVPCASTATPEG